MGFDLDLKMDCRLDLSPEVTQQLPAALEKSLEKRDNGYRSISFKLSGNAENPKVELQVTQTMVDQAVDTLKGLFGKKEKKTETPAAPATLAPAATPDAAIPSTSPAAPATGASTNAPAGQ